MARGRRGGARRYAGVQARFEPAGGYGWRDRAQRDRARPGLRRRATSTARWRRSPAAQLTRASLARALAAEPDLLLLDEPTNHLDIESLEWLEKTLVGARRGDRPRRPRPLVPGGRRHRACSSSRPAARASSRARGRRGARSRPRARSRSAARSTSSRRRSRGMERFVERFRAKATKAKQAQSRVKKLGQDRAHRARPARRQRAGVPVQGARALGPRDLRARGRRAWRSATAPRSCSTRPSCGSSAASTSRSSAPTAPARRR